MICRWRAASRNSPMRELLHEVKTLAAIMQDFGVAKGDRVILYMPMVPEAVVAMLACARIGAVHSRGVRRLCGQGTGDPDRRCAAEADLLGELRARARPHRAIQAAARRGDQTCPAPSRRPASSCSGRSSAAISPPAAITTGPSCARQAIAAKKSAPCVPVLGDRSALHPLHLRHDRRSQGRGARQWRASGGAEMVDVQSLRRQARRGLVVRLRHRLGGRPQLHRLRAAVSRRDLDHVRGQAGRHARRRRLLAGDLANTKRSRCSPRRPRSAPSARKTRTENLSASTISQNSARCFWPASAPIRRRWSGRKRN